MNLPLNSPSKSLFDTASYALLNLAISSSFFSFYNRQIKKFPTEKQNVSLKHILT